MAIVKVQVGGKVEAAGGDKEQETIGTPAVGHHVVGDQAVAEAVRGAIGNNTVGNDVVGMTIRRVAMGEPSRSCWSGHR